jgi:hypothetical protein
LLTCKVSDNQADRCNNEDDQTLLWDT